MRTFTNLTFYEQPENRDKARELIAKLIFDEWTDDEIKEYFYSLGCSIFFVRSIVNPFFINPSNTINN